MEKEDKIQWHPAFYAAVQLELKEYRDILSFEREHNLGRMPLRIDFLVIKKEPGTAVNNGIGDFFLGSNLFEYKSPGDGLDAEDFFKVMSYAYLYQSERHKGGEGLDMDLTATLFREGRPAKLLKQLEEKYQVTRTGRGIYRIGGLPFPVQIIAGRELDRREYAWVTSLTSEVAKAHESRFHESTYE